MAFTIFISSTALVLNKHYCQDQLKSTAFFFAVKSCHHQKMITVPCPIHGTMEVPAGEDDNCCDDETEYLKADQDLINYSFEVSDTEPLVFLAAFVHSFIDDTLLDKTVPADYTRYKPPLVVYVRQVRLETFLC